MEYSIFLRSRLLALPYACANVMFIFIICLLFPIFRKNKPIFRDFFSYYLFKWQIKQFLTALFSNEAISALFIAVVNNRWILALCSLRTECRHLVKALTDLFQSATHSVTEHQ